MPRQSTRYVMMVEPQQPGFNPETASTNTYQVDARESADTVHARYIAELRHLRDALIGAGVGVTTMQGPKGCPDAAFPNWFSTHEDGNAYVYPMMASNRARERSDEIVGFLRKFYTVKADLAAYELQSQALESTSSMVLDRVNRVAYIGRSRRTDEKLAKEWCAQTGYEPVIFDTIDHKGQPVYHTNVVIWLGSEIAGVGAQAIAEADRARVMKKIAATHEVMELDNAQVRNFCGNSLELLGRGDQPLLLMSDTAHGMLNSDQVSRVSRYYPKVLSAKISTIESYGGGSARCLVQELF